VYIYHSVYQQPLVGRRVHPEYCTLVRDMQAFPSAAAVDAWIVGGRVDRRACGPLPGGGAAPPNQ
jgi:hypothetical protein